MNVLIVGNLATIFLLLLPQKLSCFMVQRYRQETRRDATRRFRPDDPQQEIESKRTT